MKFTIPLLWLLFSPIGLSSPLQIDINVHVDSQDAVTNDMKKVHATQLATSTTSSKLPVASLGYEDHQASPLKAGPTCLIRINAHHHAGWPDLLCIPEHPVRETTHWGSTFQGSKAYLTIR